MNSAVKAALERRETLNSEDPFHIWDLTFPKPLEPVIKRSPQGPRVTLLMLLHLLQEGKLSQEKRLKTALSALEVAQTLLRPDPNDLENLNTVIHTLFQILKDYDPQSGIQGFNFEPYKLTLEYYMNEALTVSNMEDYNILLSKLMSFAVALGIAPDDSDGIYCKKALQLSQQQPPTKACIPFYYTALYFYVKQEPKLAEQFGDMGCALHFSKQHVQMLENNYNYKRKSVT